MFNFILRKDTILTAIFLFVFACSFSQSLSPPEKNSTIDIINYAEGAYGLDDRLVNGKVYYPLHHFAKGHPYFINANYKTGTLYIKGNTYKNVDIIYNIESDEIILKARFKDGLTTNILLNSNFIDSLIIDKHFFINSSIISNNSIGFLEQLYKGKHSAYLKHSKSFIDTQSLDVQFGEYADNKRLIYISNGKDLAKIPSKKALLTYFSIYKKDIKKYMRENSLFFKTLNLNQLHNLFNYCDGLSSTSTENK